MPRWERKFDHDQARHEYELGAPIGVIARTHGVSTSAVRRVVVPGKREQMDANSKRWYHSGVCPSCGQKATIKRSTWVDALGKQADSHQGLSADEMRAAGYHRQVVNSRCSECQQDRNGHLVKERTRRVGGASWRQLWCPGCRHWKDEHDFYPSERRKLRKRRPYCKRCETRQRREYRAKTR